MFLLKALNYYWKIKHKFHKKTDNIDMWMLKKIKFISPKIFYKILFSSKICIDWSNNNQQKLTIYFKTLF